MNTFNSFIRNLTFSNLWSIPLVILTSVFCSDLIENDATLIIFLCWFGNAVISFFIHAFLFVPCIIMYKRSSLSQDATTAFPVIYPILLIPLCIYILLMWFILSETAPKPDNFIILPFLGMALMAMHSLSLYTFIQHNLKNTTHEKLV